jgi:hypothetical protein
MKKNKIKFLLKWMAVLVLVLAAYAMYQYFKPHRNIQAGVAAAELTVESLVQEFSENPDKANKKYLSSDGNSSILIIKGSVNKISTNLSGEPVIILKNDSSKVGLLASFSKSNSAVLAGVKKGDIISVKGRITAGNHFDPDLNLYENAVLVEASLYR